MDKILELLEQNKHDPASKTFTKLLYKYYQEHNYSNKSFDKLSKDLKIKPSILKSYIYSYAKNELGKSTEEFDKYRYEQREKNNNSYLGKKNVVLEKHGIETNFIWNNDKEKELFLKEIYNYSKSNNFSDSSSKKMAEDLGISLSKYLNLLQIYMKEYIKLSDKDIEEKTNHILSPIDKRRLNDNKNALYKKILEVKTKEELKELIFNCSYDGNILRRDFRFYDKFYSVDDAIKIQARLNIYEKERKAANSINKKRVKKEKKEDVLKSQLEDAKMIVNKYIESEDISDYEFYKVNDIKVEEFKKMVEIIHKFDEELYNQYTNVLSLKDIVNTEVLKDLDYHLVNGYRQNDKVREFDILDYYLFTNIPLTKINHLKLEVLSFKGKNVLNTLRYKYKESGIDVIQEENDFLESKRIIGVEKDKFGNIIENSGRELTNEEKKFIVDYLKNNKVPVNRTTCNFCLKRYINGFIKIDNAKKITLNNN